MSSIVKVYLIRFIEEAAEFYYADSPIDLQESTLNKTFQRANLVVNTIKSRTKASGSDSLTIRLDNGTDIVKYIKNGGFSKGLAFSLWVGTVQPDGTLIKSDSVISGVVATHTADTSSTTFEIESLAQTLRDLGLRRAFSEICNHRLYGNACGADRAAFTEAGITISSFSLLAEGGAILDVSGTTLVEGRYSGGSLSYDLLGVTRSLSIVSNTGTTISIEVAKSALAVPFTASLTQGCNLSYGVCDGVFNNHERFGGFPYFAVELNPFKEDTFNESEAASVTVDKTTLPLNFIQEISP